ncbi:MAG TPA: hypothetical protein DCX32_04440 [Candidatus Moranbacteria bacterium]|nr:MAG: hypothetical protein UW87_C0002G0026 [Candidatus Moranbacteria bacterium GW2011_GWC2_45_10]KKT95196.1 MAG: hypothetical protein UW95_C0003G0038 [Parcubacteria group bacterium GW2011_GWC1_45_14]HAV11756.1 hypothetical protein [Candidatus Moranbacteria bacterium]
MTENNKINVQLTKKQYGNLLKLVYLGNWMVNAIRTDDKFKEFNFLESYIFSYAQEAGLEKYVDDEPVGDMKYFPTAEFEELVDHFKEEYDEDVFWEELADRLGERDFLRKYGEDKIKKMGKDERFYKRYEFIDKYGDELYEHGLDRIEIKGKGE